MLKQLFGNRVAVRPIIDLEEKTESGIILTNKKGTKKLIGEVVTVGKGLMLQDGTRATIDIKPGMTVIYRQFAGIQVNDGQEELIILESPDVIAEV
nr:MAG TPA: co-chaperonin [Caudoviricetes sp.]